MFLDPICFYSSNGSFNMNSQICNSPCENQIIMTQLRTNFHWGMYVEINTLSSSKSAIVKLLSAMMESPG